MLQAIKINSSNPARNSFIQNLAKNARNGFSAGFVFLQDGEEVAFLSYENNPRYLSGFIYEIYVVCKFRRQGIGSEILAFAESLAKKMGNPQ